METPYSKLVRAMRTEGAAHNGYDMAVCQVASIKPLIIIFEQMPIDHNLYCGEAYINPDDQLDKILAGEEYLTKAFKKYLTDLNKQFKILPGDYVLVQRVDNSFFVVGKVVMFA